MLVNQHFLLYFPQQYFLSFNSLFQSFDSLIVLPGACKRFQNGRSPMLILVFEKMSRNERFYQGLYTILLLDFDYNFDLQVKCLQTFDGACLRSNCILHNLILICTLRSDRFVHCITSFTLYAGTMSNRTFCACARLAFTS